MYAPYNLWGIFILGDELLNKFEEIFKNQVRELDNTYVLRLYTIGKLSGMTYPCDFIVFREDGTYLCELKSIQRGGRLSFANIRDNQWDMININIKNVFCIFPVFFIDKQVVKCYTVEELDKLRKQGKKSIKFDEDIGITVPISKQKRLYHEFNWEELFNELGKSTSVSRNAKGKV